MEHSFKFLIHLGLELEDFLFEILLLLLKELVLPLPVSLDSESFDFCCFLVLFKFFNGVSNELYIGEWRLVNLSMTKIRNSCEPSLLIPNKSVTFSLILTDISEQALCGPF